MAGKRADLLAFLEGVTAELAEELPEEGEALASSEEGELLQGFRSELMGDAAGSAKRATK
jgi:hypothetical protein